jgi:hypothetical protein
MSTDDPEFYQAPKFTPEPPQAMPRQRGCFFYGCIIALVLALLMAILIAVSTYFLFRFADQTVKEYTATAPQELPKVEMPAENRQALKDRVEAFRTAADEGTSTEPLVLTSDDLNALIEEDEDLKGKIFVKIVGDEITGQVSIPLDPLAKGPFRAMFQGRYLNGKADLKASLQNGVLMVTLDSIEVNGKKPPEELLAQLRQENLAKDAHRNPKFAGSIRKLESLEVKDGKIILKVRAKADSTTPKEKGPIQKEVPPAGAAPKADPPKADDEPKTKAQTPAAEAPANKP